MGSEVSATVCAVDRSDARAGWGGVQTASTTLISLRSGASVMASPVVLSFGRPKICGLGESVTRRIYDPACALWIY